MNAETPIGAVLVVGGGIAGMQASLDLAEQGFRVYLVEAQSAIGGHMAQLDKTFPTNDCAMCNLSPKLVETGRHLNIEILTETEVLDVAGEVGHFTATLRRLPRYVDPLKCVGCGDCATVCPVTVPNEFDAAVETTGPVVSTRHAAYRLFPQAIPSAYAITKRGIAPCKNACPAETSAQGYVALIAQKRYSEALEVIKQYNPFPASVGRVCHHPCEAACTRGRVDSPVAICDLKRFVADHQAGEPVTQPSRDYDERIAVVGAGPAGLSAAHQLVRLGYGVTVFEALPVPGGMMRVGIPAYRLPRDVLAREIGDILAEGVDLRLNSPVHDINALFTVGDGPSWRPYAAIFLAVGAHQPQELGIPGERGTAGVHYGVAFLREVSLQSEGISDFGFRISESQSAIRNQRVIVVGGGNTAIDAARTAIRLGARQVTLLYRRTRAEMPAHPREVEAGEAEGLKVELLTAPVEVLSENGRLAGVRCVRMRLGEPDASGRPRPVPIPGSEFIVEADALIPAVAQAPEISLLAPDHGLTITRWGTFAVDPDTLATNRPNVFAGGDAARGPATLIEAIAHGRRAALSIHRTLRGLPLRTPREMEPLPVVHIPDDELAERRERKTVRPTPRAVMPVVPAAARAGDFREVELGLAEEQALAEARRCLECGLCAECYQCVNACKANAIDHTMAARHETIEIGAVILAPGYQVYNAQLSEEYGFGRYPNVVTSLQFERLLSASGPTSGHVQRPSDGAKAKKIAFLQCIGSRDLTHDYCSAVCCMYAAKEAIMAKEHERDTEVHVFMMDMRAFSKGYAEYYQRARERYGVQYHRCRISALTEDPATHNLVVRYQTADGVQSPTNGLQPSATLAPHASAGVSHQQTIVEDQFDLVVLSVGMEISSPVRELGRRLGIELDPHGFCRTTLFDPVQTSRPGIYAAGPFREPKDIPESVVDASGAAASVAERLAASRGLLAREREYPDERDVIGQPPRVGVFVCHCGSNIAGFLDVPGVAASAKTLPGVVHAENLLYACSQDSITAITERVLELGLNRVVVAACTPRTHEPLFQDSIRAAGLNPFLFEMANIRNQCSWVHADHWDVATAKAKDLVRMSVARVSLQEPLHRFPVPIERAALVIGGGPAGMTAALSLAEQGFAAHLVERNSELGGNLRNVFYTSEISNSESQTSNDPQAFLRDLIGRVSENPLVMVHLNAELSDTTGFVGNFVSRLTDGAEIRHGVTIVATGGKEYRGDEYLYGQDGRVKTQQEFEALLANPQSEIGNLQSVVMIQCVGPAERYCGRLCCTTALKNALRLKALNPKADVTILYTDIRTYGFKERLYTEARRQGVRFIRYEFDRRPDVEIPNSKFQIPNDGLQSVISNLQSPIIVRVWEPILGADLELRPDLLVLSTPMVPADGARELGSKLKVPVDADGWFLEAHVKLRPVEFASEGLFLAGAAHYPKFLDEIIVQAKAAASRAAAILARPALAAGGVVAAVDPSKCTACLTCVRICPYFVPKIMANVTGVGNILGAAYIEPAICQGCGLCAAECPAKAISLLHYRGAQMAAKVEALFEMAAT
ncbi:MAG: FAD-dependent oxidoreductase [Chloroflexi bacterium]|nr:FAD-dependent oxidoreductase [Chloroflexota bacterium]